MGLVLALVSCLLFSFLCFCLLVCIICSKLCPCLSCCRSTSQKISNLNSHVQVALQLSPPLWIKRLQPPERTTASSKLHFPPSYMEGQVLRNMQYLRNMLYSEQKNIFSPCVFPPQVGLTQSIWHRELCQLLGAPIWMCQHNWCMSFVIFW